LIFARTLPSPVGRGFHGGGGGRRGVGQTGEAFEDGNADFLGAAGVDSGFVDNDIAGLEQAGDGFAGFDQWREIRALGCVNGGGDGDDEDVAVSQVGRIGSAGQVAGGLQLLCGGFEGAVQACPELFDTIGADVVANGRKVLAEFNGEREANIAEANNADSRVWPMGYICFHGGRVGFGWYK
jgi:hypothetical protein